MDVVLRYDPKADILVMRLREGAFLFGTKIY